MQGVVVGLPVGQSHKNWAACHYLTQGAVVGLPLGWHCENWAVCHCLGAQGGQVGLQMVASTWRLPPLLGANQN